MLVEVLIVGFGGFLGSALRYLISLAPFGDSSLFPFKTFFVNIIGCFIIGFLSFLILRECSFNEYFVLFLKVGLCGGFTTFSSFALESGDLFRGGDFFIGFLYIVLSVCIGVFLIFLPDILFKY